MRRPAPAGKLAGAAVHESREHTTLTTAAGALLPAAAFLLGSIPFGLVLPRLRGVDIRKEGSGNIGATNVLRSQGKAMAATVLLLDAAKGVVPTLVAWKAGGPALAAASGTCAVLGHCFSIFLRGKGGKGVATGLGVFLALAPAAAAIGVAVFVAVVAWSRYVSLGSLVAAFAIPVAAAALGSPAAIVLAAVATALVIAWRHQDNIRRLLKGNEAKLGQRAAPPASPAATAPPAP